MSGSPAVVLRLVASAYTVAEKAGDIVRKVLNRGDVGIVEKVRDSSTSVCKMRLILYVPVACRRGPMICRHLRTDLHSGASVPHYPDASQRSLSLPRR